MAIYGKIVDKMTKILTHLAGFALFSVLMSVIIQIVARNFLKIPVAWTEEVAKYAMIWMTYLGSPVALKKSEHLMVDLFYNAYPKKVRQYVHLFCDVIVAVFCVYMLVNGYKMCVDPKVLRYKSPSAQIPRVAIYASLPVGSLAMLIVAIYDIINTILMIMGKVEDTTGSNIVDENISLAELDKKRKEA